MDRSSGSLARLSIFGGLLFFAAFAFSQSGIEGVYRFVEDQPAGMSAAKGAEILLSVSPQGTMSITATQPGNVLTTLGSYQIRGNRISLSFPELDKTVSDGAWRIEGDFLFLPLQFTGDGPGTSKWQRVKSGRGPIQRFFETLNREHGKGTPVAGAVKRAAEEAQRSVAAGEDRALQIRQFRVWPGGGGCTLVFADGHREEVEAASASAETESAVGQGMSPLARDPRTHIPVQPSTAPDDPQSLSAVLFAPFDTTPYLALEWGAVGGVGPGSVVRVTSHKEAGEDLDFITEKLRSRNYTIDPLRDAAATPLALHDSIRGHRPAPGVIYLSTHGGATQDGIYMATGVCLGTVAEENEIHKNSERVREIIGRTVPAGYFGAEMGIGNVAAKPVTSLWLQKNREFPVAFLCITDRFFAKLREEGADFGSSFIFANGCETVHNKALVEACGARMLLGHCCRTKLPAVLAEARWIFTRLAKRTFSLREVLGLLQHIVKTREKIFPEDSGLARVAPQNFETLALYGRDGSACELPSFDVLYLCWLARWDSKDTDAGSQALQSTYDQFWSKKMFSRLKSAFANAGVRGTHMPSVEEVLFARHLVSGVPTMACGRFTLNDTDPPSRGRSGGGGDGLHKYKNSSFAVHANILMRYLITFSAIRSRRDILASLPDRIASPLWPWFMHR